MLLLYATTSVFGTLQLLGSHVQTHSMLKAMGSFTFQHVCDAGVL